MSEVKSVNINLTAEEANYVLHALSQRPFAEVANLIMKVQSQANAQVKSEEKTS